MANITGTGGNDLLVGTTLGDTIQGFGGDDNLFGRDGNDYLAGGSGADALRGEAGNDLLEGGAGSDLLDGGAGLDTVTYQRAQGPVTVDLGLGVAFGAQGGDSLNSIENVIGGNSNDTLVGSAAANRLTGNGGNDELRGGAGNDRLDGGTGSDRLDGGNGNDVVRGGTGSDSLDGGAGTDTLDCSGAANGLYVDLGGIFVSPRVTDGNDTDAISGFEVVIGSAFADHMGSSEQGSRLIGGAGDDDLVGWVYRYGAIRDTTDVLEGGNGNDTLRGYGGDDTLSGGNGNDSLDGYKGDDRLVGGAGADVLVFRNIHDGGAVPDGEDLIADFTRGQDKFLYDVSVSSGALFAFLDSNHDNVLDDTDANVEVRNVTDGGVTRLSTVIDYNAVWDTENRYPGHATFFGVTGLTASDFV